MSPKHWTNPSGKMQVLQLSHINVFKRKAIFVARMSPQKLAEKRQGEETSHFLSKAMD